MKVKSSFSPLISVKKSLYSRLLHRTTSRDKVGFHWAHWCSWISGNHWLELACRHQCILSAKLFLSKLVGWLGEDKIVGSILTLLLLLRLVTFKLLLLNFLCFIVALEFPKLHDIIFLISVLIVIRLVCHHFRLVMLWAASSSWFWFYGGFLKVLGFFMGIMIRCVCLHLPMLLQLLHGSGNSWTYLFIDLKSDLDIVF